MAVLILRSYNQRIRCSNIWYAIYIRYVHTDNSGLLTRQRGGILWVSLFAELKEGGQASFFPGAQAFSWRPCPGIPEDIVSCHTLTLRTRFSLSLQHFYLKKHRVKTISAENVIQKGFRGFGKYYQEEPFNFTSSVTTLSLSHIATCKLNKL
jgi:hypothetical protein